jgi:glycosyltransferase involved in cell wall biosynthesis
MRVLEILNAFPGETFLQQHAQAVMKHTSIELSWAFCQTNHIGAYAQAPVPGLKNCIALINPNRISRSKKILNKIRYLNHPDSYSKQLRAQVKELNPDIVHFQFASLAVRHVKVVQQLQIPFTFSIRGSDVQIDPIQYGDSYIQQLKQVVHHATAIHAVTTDLQQTLFAYCGENQKTQVIRTCVAPEWKALPRTPQTNEWVAIGRLNWRKGFSDLLLACKILKTDGIKFHLAIIGEGPQRPQLEFMIRDLNLTDTVTLVGQKGHAEISTHLSNASLFILSSIQEGFPNVLAEAMLASVPIVSTALPGVCEVVEAGIAGELAAVGNPESLAHAIRQTLLLDSPALKTRVVNAQQVATSVFNPQLHAQAFDKFWSEAR